MPRNPSDILLRIALAFAFLYPPIDAVFNPDSWIGYFPSILRGFVPDLLLLHAFGAVEVVLAVWILTGKRIFWPSLVMCAMLLAIIITNAPAFEILFRDLALAILALGLAFAHLPRARAAAGE